MLFLLHYRRQPVVDLICYLARSANLPTGLYILLALISSFFLFLTMSKAISVSTGPIATNATKILAKISPVISAENILIEIALRRGSAYVVQYLWIYWTDFRNHFTMWKSFTCQWWIYTSFSNLSWALPWQPNNFDIIKVNWYYVHYLQFGRWSTVLFRYYLLGGDTVAPSGLLARLCHAFLVPTFFTYSFLRNASSHSVISMVRCFPVPCFEEYHRKVHPRPTRNFISCVCITATVTLTF